MPCLVPSTAYVFIRAQDRKCSSLITPVSSNLERIGGFGGLSSFHSIGCQLSICSLGALYDNVQQPYEVCP